MRAYLVSYTAGQVLPTAVGGDASRVYETARRHSGRLGDLTAIVLLERALGGVATLVLAAIGFALALGRYNVGAYLWIEGAFVVGTIVLGVLFFSHRARGPLRRFVPVLRRLRVERPLRALYEGVHVLPRAPSADGVGLASDARCAGVRVLAIWMAGRSVGIELSPRPYYVMGPLLFLVILVPVHDQRARGPRGVLRQLPDAARRRQGVGARVRLPVFRRHDRACAARRRDPRGSRICAGLRGPARRS